MPLTENDIKAELSYAYLHAVASRAGMICEVAGRLSDGAGVDARLHVKERFAPPPSFTDFTMEVQLKATAQHVPMQEDRYSFWLEPKSLYDKLRTVDAMSQKLLVVLLLPPDPESWLSHSEEGLIARRCAYWVSLRGAPATENANGQTVYVPQANLFSVAAVRGLAARVARREELHYAV